MHGRKTDIMKNTRTPRVSRPPRHRSAKPQSPPPKERPDVVLRLLILTLLFAVIFYGMRADWFLLRNVEIRGGVRLSDAEITDLAALSDFDDAWTFLIPRELIRQSLEKHPLIESAKISITSPWSIMIEISERRPLAALEYKGSMFLFDRTSELIDIIGPGEICMYPVFSGVPVGLLRFRHEPLYSLEEAWSLPAGCNAASMDLQLNRMIHLQHLLNRSGENCPVSLDRIEMMGNGDLRVLFKDCPQILLGKFDNADVQFRRMIAVLQNEEILNPERIIDIDLSSELFPCYHVRQEYLTRTELRQITDWDSEADDNGADETNEAESVDEDAFADSDGESGEVAIGSDIFSLTGDPADEEE
jgi:hypothetical protein